MLLGKLNFSQPMCFGRFGRGMLGAIKGRQYARTGDRRRRLNRELTESLKWWDGALSCAPTRRISPRFTKPVVACADAEGIGRCDAVIFPPECDAPAVLRKHAPSWTADKSIARCGIFGSELIAAALGIFLPFLTTTSYLLSSVVTIKAL